MLFNHNEWSWLHILCKDMDRARSLTVSLLVKYGEWDQLVNLRCDPSEYAVINTTPGLRSWIVLNSFGFRYDYQITELLRKCADLPVHADPKAAAYASFYSAEEQCAVTNARMQDLEYQIKHPCFRRSAQYDLWCHFTEKLQDNVKTLLGDLPEELTPKFSSGSTYDDRRYIFVQDKMTNRPTATEQSYHIIEPFWSKTMWSQSLCIEQPYRSLPKFVLGNRFTTVPKSAITDRGICVEPSLNVTHQLSVGAVIRRRLRRHGIDLITGQSTHKKLVEMASSALDLGTIDLSSASDTVAYEFVKLALGKTKAWFDLLDSLRSPFTRIAGVWHRNRKFSSMGNGYTFELETLLFYALGLTLCQVMNYNRRVLSVYGDDIIIDTPMANHMISVLRFFGFIPNVRKTYVNNVPFRESCGADFYLGQPVRGHYVENLPKEPTDWISLANGIRRMARADLNNFGNLCDYHNCWLACLRHLPKPIKTVRGPEYLGDVVLHDDHWEDRALSRWFGGVRHIKAVIPQFNERDYTSYDRPFWNRGAILGAAVGGFLYGQGDKHRSVSPGQWKTIPGRMLSARSQPIGYQIKWIEISTATSNWLPSQRSQN